MNKHILTGADLERFRNSDPADPQLLGAHLFSMLRDRYVELQDLQSNPEDPRISEEIKDLAKLLPVEPRMPRDEALIGVIDRMRDSGYSDRERADAHKELSKGERGRPRDPQYVAMSICAAELYLGGATWLKVADELCVERKHYPHQAPTDKDIDGNILTVGEDKCAGNFSSRATPYLDYLKKYGWANLPEHIFRK